MLLLALTTSLAGCHRWVAAGPPDEALRQATGDDDSQTYRVHLMDGGTIEGKVVGATRDSLVIDDREAGPVTIGADAVERMDVRRANVFGTVLLTATLIAAPFIIYGVALAISCSGLETCPS